MGSWRRKLALGGLVVSLVVGLLGVRGMSDKGVRHVDILAIFAGGFACGVSFLQLLRTVRGHSDDDAPKSKGGA